ncbi:MAG: conjugal transfer protein TrbL family protein [Candidatus Dormibacteria bacterium]
MAVLAVSLDPLHTLTHAIVSVLTHFVDSGRDDLLGVLNRYLFSTVDTTHHGIPFTANPNLARLNAGLAIAVDALLVLVVLVASLRSMFERATMHAKYSLKVVLPRILLAVVLAHGSMLFMQMAIDLNNALAQVALHLGDDGPVGTPWGAPLSAASMHQMSVGEDLFHAVFAIALVIAVVILVFSYVVRTALLGILVVTAPLAALLGVLPDTRDHARTWLKLFSVAVFMQTTQLLVLRVAMVTGLAEDAGIVSMLYSIATLWIMLKVPGALSTGAHLETKARSLGHELGRHALKAIHPAAHHVTHRTAA